MKPRKVNDMVIRFANVNGTGSASANDMFAKAVFRMGIPVSPKNIFPSNIQGLPTWFEMRISEKGYLGRRAEIDLMVGVNPATLIQDIASIHPGGYLVYDSSKLHHTEHVREDIHYIGIPMMQMCMEHYDDPRQQQLFKNIVYVGALVALLNMEMEVVKNIVRELFATKEKLIPPNFKALYLGFDYAKNNYDCPIGVCVKRINKIGDKIMMEGNAAIAIGAVYGGATVMAWYPITPSTSVAKAYETYCKKLRIEPESGKKKYAFLQAEDELAAIGMVIGAAWNGARAFTATSGPGISLMSEFIGLAYFAEIPAVIVNVQRGGPSTGMPTRTQQPDILSTAYASHGDTKHMLLFPRSPAECFEMAAQAFDLADRFQTPVFIMSDLDLGMNNHLSPPLKWDDSRKYDIGKLMSAEDLEIKEFGRYLDVDGDGICYRTIPGTHPTKGAFFTRGTSRNEYAKYTENGEDYVSMVNRILKKWETAKNYVPGPEFYQKSSKSTQGIIFFGTTTDAALEAIDILKEQGIEFDSMRVRAFPFNQEVKDFIHAHEEVFVVEQNRDAQFRSLLINELELNPAKLTPVLNYDGMPITANFITQLITKKVAVS